MLTLASNISAPPNDALKQKVLPLMNGLVHDLRQPLSVIDACADYLNLVLPADDHGARRQVELLQQQVGEANRILHETLLSLHYVEAGPATADATTNAASPGVSRY